MGFKFVVCTMNGMVVEHLQKCPFAATATGAINVRDRICKPPRENQWLEILTSTNDICV